MLKKRLNVILVALLPIGFYLGVTLLTKYCTHSICLFKLFTGHECWGCGMTRAFNALFHLKIEEAFAFNPRIVIVAPLMLWIWACTFIKTIRKDDIQNAEKQKEV